MNRIGIYLTLLVTVVLMSSRLSSADNLVLLGEWEIRETQDLPQVRVSITEGDDVYESAIFDPRNRLRPVTNGEDFAQCDNDSDGAILCASVLDPKFSYTVEKTGNENIAVMKYIWGNLPHDPPQIYTHLLSRVISE